MHYSIHLLTNMQLLCQVLYILDHMYDSPPGASTFALKNKCGGQRVCVWGGGGGQRVCIS